MSTGLILFAHGAREASWREPFVRLEALVSQRHPGPVSLAFLERMSPDLPGAAAKLVRAGAARIVVVPVFLGTGGHVHIDLPALLAKAQESAGVPVTGVTPVGEDTVVLQAIAEYCLRSAG